MASRVEVRFQGRISGWGSRSGFNLLGLGSSFKTGIGVKFQGRDMGQGLVGVGFRDGGQDRVSGLDRDQVLGQGLGFRVGIGFRNGGHVRVLGSGSSFKWGSGSGFGIGIRGQFLRRVSRLGFGDGIRVSFRDGDNVGIELQVSRLGSGFVVGFWDGRRQVHDSLLGQISKRRFVFEFQGRGRVSECESGSGFDVGVGLLVGVNFWDCCHGRMEVGIKFRDKV